jgi:hypothetical protein
MIFYVPCPRGGDPLEHLSEEQAALIRPRNRVTCIAAADNPRDRDVPRIVTLYIPDNGRGDGDP